MSGKKRIVIKVGTSTLTHASGVLNLQRIERMARVLADLHGMGHEVILVSSGAIAVGVAELQMGARPTELRYKQAAAAVGQCNIMHIYDKFFSEYTCAVGQILLTGDDVDDPVRSEHLTNTFNALLEMGVIPIVNENDSVSSAEIETGHNKVLGDNDTLSAIVAGLCRADLLVLLSDIEDQCNDLFHAFASQALLSLNRFRTLPSGLPSSTMLRRFSRGHGLFVWTVPCGRRIENVRNGGETDPRGISSQETCFGVIRGSLPWTGKSCSPDEER